MHCPEKPVKPRSKTCVYQDEITPAMGLDIIKGLEELRMRTPLWHAEIYGYNGLHALRKQLESASGVTVFMAARLKKLARFFLIDEVSE